MNLLDHNSAPSFCKNKTQPLPPNVTYVFLVVLGSHIRVASRLKQPAPRREGGEMGLGPFEVQVSIFVG